ncbi:MAG: DUF1905 domain-containing protein [Methylophilaceae bacterium]
MIDLSFSFTGKCWLWQSKGAAWHFISLPKDKSEEIKFFNENLSVKKRGWGSVRVVATVGKTEWKTSIFPQKEGAYLLPIKADVRKQEKILVDSEVQVTLKIDV